MKIKDIIVVAGVLLAACVPPRYVEVDAYAADNWYQGCTWDYPCYYVNGEVVTAFVYGWGYFPQDRFVIYRARPELRERIRQPAFIPHERPHRRDFEGNHHPDRRDAGGHGEHNSRGSTHDHGHDRHDGHRDRH